jgi:hypothetical protein
MTVDDAPGTVTLYRRGRTGLYADEHGVTVRNPGSRIRRVAWAEISCFADGGSIDHGSYFWVLHIILHTGRKIKAIVPPTPETLAAIRQVASRHGIPADVAGIPVKKGRPIGRGWYEDPGGLAGLRYWDGEVWSPLLPPDICPPGSVRASHGSWSALPVAEGRWTGAKTAARHRAGLFALTAAMSAVLAALGLLSELGLYRGGHHGRFGAWDAWLSAYVCAVLLAFLALAAWRGRKFFLKVDEAANGSADSWR